MTQLKTFAMILILWTMAAAASADTLTLDGFYYGTDLT